MSNQQRSVPTRFMTCDRSLREHTSKQEATRGQALFSTAPGQFPPGHPGGGYQGQGPPGVDGYSLQTCASTTFSRWRRDAANHPNCLLCYKGSCVRLQPASSSGLAALAWIAQRLPCQVSASTSRPSKLKNSRNLAHKMGSTGPYYGNAQGKGSQFASMGSSSKGDVFFQNILLHLSIVHWAICKNSHHRRRSDMRFRQALKAAAK